MRYQSFEEAGIIIPPGRHGDVKLRCPKCHGDRRHQSDLSLSVNVEKGTWMCHNPGCAWNESPGGLRSATPFAYAAEPEIYALPDRLPLPPDHRVYAWFAKRGIDQHVVDRNHIGWAVRPIGNTRFEEYLAFPVFRDGVHVNTKYRAFTDKKFSQDAGCEAVFQGMDDLLGAETVIVVEGEIDKLSIEQATGYRNVVSFPNGAGTSLDKVMPKFVERTKHIKQFLLAGDTDEAGKKLLDDFAKRVGIDRCWVVDWLGCKDANEAMQTLGAPVIEGCLRNARPMPLAGTVTFNDLREKIKALRQYREHGVPIMPNALGARLRVDRGFLLVITGIPQTGKSRLIDNVIVHTVRMNQWRWAVCSPESWPAELHAKHIIQIAENKPLAAIPELAHKGMTDMEIDTAIDRLDPYITLVTPESLTLDGVIETMRQLVVSRGVDAIVLDPWNRMGHKRPNGTSMTDYVGESLAALKTFAQNYNVLIVLAAHPSKPESGKRNEQGITMVGPYDIADSHNFYDMSDFILCLGRDKKNAAAGTLVDVAKVKTEEFGEPGTDVVLFYNKYTGLLTDTPEV